MTSCMVWLRVKKVRFFMLKILVCKPLFWDLNKKEEHRTDESSKLFGKNSIIKYHTKYFELKKTNAAVVAVVVARADWPSVDFGSKWLVDPRLPLQPTHSSYYCSTGLTKPPRLPNLTAHSDWVDYSLAHCLHSAY